MNKETRPQEIEFIEATNKDLEYLIELRKQTMSKHLLNSLVNQTPAQMRERVQYRLDCAKIILVDGEKGGLLKVVKDSKDWELSQIQITGKFQHRGLGGKIIRAIIQEARQKNAKITLTVLKANPARRLYERLGFNIVSEGPHSFRMKCKC